MFSMSLKLLWPLIPKITQRDVLCVAGVILDPVEGTCCTPLLLLLDSCDARLFTGTPDTLAVFAPAAGVVEAGV